MDSFDTKIELRWGRFSLKVDAISVIKNRGVA